MQYTHCFKPVQHPVKEIVYLDQLGPNELFTVTRNMEISFKVPDLAIFGSG